MLRARTFSDHVCVALGHALLHSNGAFYHVDHTGEFDRRTVAHEFHDAPAVARNFEVDTLGTMSLERSQRTGLVHALIR